MRGCIIVEGAVSILEEEANTPLHGPKWGGIIFFLGAPFLPLSGNALCATSTRILDMICC